MTTKVANPKPGEALDSSSEDLRAAYQIHTLSQMLYGQMALGHPWQAYPPYFSGPLSSYEPSPMPQATPWTADERCGLAWTMPGWYR